MYTDVITCILKFISLFYSFSSVTFRILSLPSILFFFVTQQLNAVFMMFKYIPFVIIICFYMTSSAHADVILGNPMQRGVPQFMLSFTHV